jgi:TolB protein
VGLLVLGVLVAAGPASATFPGQDGRIVFASERGELGLSIYTMTPDGSDVRSLTHHPPFAGGPVWSPDGSRIAFMAGLSSDLPPEAMSREIWTVAPDGTHLRPLAQDLNVEDEQSSYLRWSPDGRRLVYVVPPTSFGTQGEIWTIAADGGSRRQVTQARRLLYGDPVWSPDGNRLAFARYIIPTSGDIWTIRADGSRSQQLTRTTDDDSFPSWSPDGRRIAFQRNHGVTQWIYVMRADGSRPRRIVRGMQPRWAPRGDSIAFRRRSRIFVVGADGKHAHALGDGYDAVWSPDASRLAILRNRLVTTERGPSYVWDVEVVRPNGTGRRRVFTGPGGTGSPSWSPDGTRLVLAVAPSFHRGELYLVRADGGGAAPLLDEWPALDYNPAVSADGRTVAFTRKVPDSDCTLCLRQALHTVSTEGSGLRRFAKWSNDQAWAPDGSKLVVADVDLDIVALADGSQSMLVRHTETVFRGITTITRMGGPAWSPDGSRIAYLIGGVAGQIALFTFGSGSRTLGPRGLDLAWSPDGRTLAYTGAGGIVALDVETLSAKLLMAGASQAAWSPDGTQLAYVRMLGRNSEIFIANVDGSGERRITFNPGPDFAPDWAPG